MSSFDLRFRPRGRGRGARVLAAATALALLVAACGGESGSSSASDNTDGGGKVDRTAILQYAADINAGGQPYFDPVKNAGGSTSRAVVDMIYDTLIRETPDGGTEPGLATAWETPDDKTVVLTIREGVKFQDGTDLDAEAVKFSIDRVLEAQAPNLSPKVNAISSVEVSGSQVTLDLSEPVAGSLIRDELLSSQYIAIVSPTAVKELGDAFSDSPVGAGPFRFESYEPDQRISVRSWDGYWDAENLDLAGVDILQIQTGAPTVNALLAGQVQAGDVALSDVAGVENEPDLKLITQATDTTMQLPLCTTQAPFDSPLVREAISYAIDREAMNAAVYGGYGDPTEVPVASTSPNYDAELDDQHPYDPEKAQELLDEAGVEPGTEMSILVPSNQPAAMPAGEVVQQQLKAVGLNVTLLPSLDFLADQKRLKPDAIILGLQLKSLVQFLDPEGAANWCGFTDPELTESLTRTNGVDPDAVKSGWHDTMARLQETNPIVFFVTEPVAIGASNKVQGWGDTVIHTNGQGPTFRTLSLTE